MIGEVHTGLPSEQDVITLYNTEEQLMVHDKVFDEDFFTTRESASRTYSPMRRRKTRRHRRLLEHYDQPTGSWSSRALNSYLHALALNTSSEAWCVGGHDACIDGRQFTSPDEPRALS